MSVKPILFNTEMVRAILDGRKTVTRRVVIDYDKYERLLGIELKFPMQVYKAFNSPCEPGDILWVRETWKKVCASERYFENGEVVSSDELFGYKYRADNSIRWDIRSPRDDEFFLSEIIEAAKWHPSIHMPREAARIFLRVTNVRVERLRHITQDGAIAEGCNAAIPVLEFKGLWDSTIKPADRDRYGWAANPFCWVIAFERCDAPPQWGVQSATGQRPAFSAEQKPEEAVNG